MGFYVIRCKVLRINLDDLISLSYFRSECNVIAPYTITIIMTSAADDHWSSSSISPRPAGKICSYHH